MQNHCQPTLWVAGKASDGIFMGSWWEVGIICHEFHCFAAFFSKFSIFACWADQAEEYQNETITKTGSNSTRARQSRSTMVKKEGRFSCDECEATFSGSDKVKRHKQSKHQGELVRENRCEECNSFFSKLSHLTRHKQSKHAGSGYNCDQCDYKTGRQDNLTAHTNSKHLGVRYPCDQCGYKATDKVKQIYLSFMEGTGSHSSTSGDIASVH